MSDGLKGWQEALEKITPQKMTVERALNRLNGLNPKVDQASEFLRQHIAKLEADARRYRWLRDGLETNDVDVYEIAEAGHRGGIDQPIDRAMGEK